MADVIKHIGVPRRSGRYPWGSGDNPYQRSKNFLAYVDEMKAKGMSEVEIAKGMGMNTRQLRERRANARATKRAADAALAVRLKEKGYSNVAIGERMGINESSVRSLLDKSIQERANQTANTAKVLKEAVDNKGLIDIGVGTEQYMGVSRTKLNNAVAKLRDEEGYTVHTIQVQQVGTGKYTNVKVLAPPGTDFPEVSRNRYNIEMPHQYSIDGGRTFLGLEPPTVLGRDRIMVRYGDEGGADRDGVIQLRRGVDDISLGDKRYAQVRMAVEGDKFMKGMAMYGHDKDFPPGIDIIYNTNKKSGTPDADVFKPMKDDPDNPFGSIVRQRHYIDATGKKRLSAINAVGSVEGAGEEGAWNEWSKSLSSQILSKQRPALAQRQLELAFGIKKDEFDEIMSLTNPTVKRELLQKFADEADADAVHLKAAALPRQRSQVLLPFTSMSPDEVYAPNFRDGESVVLIRHPHGGIFEIPTLKVNNRAKEPKNLIGDALDAVGIHPDVAQRLSGADFDGDTVIVIPNDKKYIKTSSPLAGLKDFDPQTAYPKYDGMKVMSPALKQMEMGKISNLITDMTIRGASHDEIARAVRHSMVVIDAEKHKLNYKQSYLDNNIADLKERYQGKSTGGASTIISKASSTIRVNERKEGKYVTDPKTGKKKRVYIDPDTGDLLYRETGATYTNKQGKIVKKQTKTTRMAEESDAHKLSSGTTIESIYADHANALKNLARSARKNSLKVEDIPYSRSARETFKEQVSTLKDKLSLAYRNKPLERAAQLAANQVIAAKRKANPDMTPDEVKKIKVQALEEQRARYGAKKSDIQITDREWLAIQAGAISPTQLKQILSNTDTSALKQKAMPKTFKGMSPAKQVRARSMLSTGHTRAEIADALGVSLTTLIDTLGKEGE